MKNYKITVSYDGTRYKGWQVLKSTDATIQGKLQMVLSALAGHPVEVIGSGRTDAGVHAEGNVAVFDCDTTIPSDKIKYALNNLLPEDIVVVESIAAEDNFHPRHCDCRKTYQYRILNTALPDPNRRRNTYFYRGRLDIDSHSILFRHKLHEAYNA